MLQQTVVTAAVEPYRRWLERWPDLASLAAAEESEVLAAWEGLGYASRARNLHRAARQLGQAGATNLPDTYEALRALPGIGDYTASAVLSFAFDQSVLTLDANLKRVFQRLDAAPDWTPALEARWRAAWAQLVTGPTSREANQGLMQLGQLVCTARKPACLACPLAAGCQARAQGLQDTLPRRAERSVTELDTRVAVWRRGADVWLARPALGRFSTLWLFPPWTGQPPADARDLAPRVHTYTRYRDRLAPFVAEAPEGADPVLPAGWVGRWADPRQAAALGLASVYRKIYQEALS